ncbi:hypothetical protein ACR79K_27200 [Sphingobacterium siyangense]|uniref:hypothetical protein n=1 Tax=Sphingobacterium siyangense TaxID=459529 RepID=UPI003DA3D7A7
MDSVFIKVSTKDRLPLESGLYLTNNGHVHFLSGCKRFMGCDPKWWLEEVELPTEDEILEYARDEEGLEDYDMEQDVFVDGANYILNTLKGEKR